MNEPHWHIGDVIRKLREQRRWSQKKLAERAIPRKNKATIVRVEEGAASIQMDTYEAIAQAFEMTLGQLFSLIPGEGAQRRAAAATGATSFSNGSGFRPGYSGPERRTHETAGDRPPGGQPDRRRAG